MRRYCAAKRLHANRRRRKVQPRLSMRFVCGGCGEDKCPQFNVCACDIWKQSAEQLEEAGVPHSQAREQTRVDACTLAWLAGMVKYKHSQQAVPRSDGWAVIDSQPTAKVPSKSADREL